MQPFTDPIAWPALASALGTLGGDGVTRSERGGTNVAREAIGILLGSARLSDAVDFYVSGQPGFELARSVLWLLRPWPAMLRCRELFASAQHDVSVRRSAVELLRVVADARALPWVADFLRDPDAGVQLWGIGVVDQLVFSRLVEPDDCAAVLRMAQHHSNAAVRERAAEIAQQLEAASADDREDSSSVTRDKPVVELWEAVGLGVIIDYPSGVLYSNQTGGFSCLHPVTEGIYVPVRNDTLETGELIGPERDLQKFFEGAEVFGRWCDLWPRQRGRRFNRSNSAECAPRLGVQGRPRPTAGITRSLGTSRLVRGRRCAAHLPWVRPISTTRRSYLAQQRLSATPLPGPGWTPEAIAVVERACTDGCVHLRELEMRLGRCRRNLVRSRDPDE